jgi:hypothetical protein
MMRIKDLAQGMLWPMRVHPRLLAKPSPMPASLELRGYKDTGHIGLYTTMQMQA